MSPGIDAGKGIEFITRLVFDRTLRYLHVDEKLITRETLKLDGEITDCYSYDHAYYNGLEGLLHLLRIINYVGRARSHYEEYAHHRLNLVEYRVVEDSGKHQDKE